MATAQEIAFLRKTTRKVAKAAVRKARPRVRRTSKTLARAMHVVQPKDNEAWAYIPHYWAAYVHNGRSPFSKPFAMVFFRDIQDDPRLRGRQTPQRASQLRRLSREEFLFWLERNREADPDGSNPRARPMIVTRTIRKPTIANRFFDNKDGMRGFRQEASEIFQADFRRLVASVVPGVGVPVVDRAVVRL